MPALSVHRLSGGSESSQALGLARRRRAPGAARSWRPRRRRRRRAAGPRRRRRPPSSRRAAGRSRPDTTRRCRRDAPRPRPLAAAQVVEQRGLEAAEAEAAAAGHGAREADVARVAARRQLVELPAARVAEAEQPGAFVEGLAGRVVHGPGGDAVAHALLDDGQQRVPAAGDEAHEGRFDAQRVVRGDVPLEVVHRDQGQSAAVGERLRRRQADEQGADQARALGRGDGAEVVPAHAGLGHGLSDDLVDELGVATRRHLRHHAAELGVQLVLRGDDRREDLGPAHDRGAGVVAGGLHGEDAEGPVPTAARRSRTVPFPVLPHDHGVLAVVAVVARPDPRGDEPETPIELDAGGWRLAPRACGRGAHGAR